MNNFDEIVSTYNNIVPLRGPRKAEDIRPLGSRRTWYNRIIKVSDTKYVLTDGSYMYQSSSDVSAYAPIIWERKEDGDYLTVRLCSSGSYCISRYTFLGNYLPNPLWFRIENGKHYIVEGGKGWGTQKVSEHYLPKFVLKNVNGNWEMDKDRYIQFKHVNSKFTRTTELLPMKLRRLDKDLVKKYDPLIKEMWDWAHIVMPILGDTMKHSATRHGYAEVFETSPWYWDKAIDSDLVQQVLENPEHDNRMALCALACYNAGMFSVDGSDGRFNPTHKKAFYEFKKVLRKVAGVQAVELR
jgi:hypothetical protein